MRTIFISHSAKTDADRQYVEALAGGLTAAGFEPWLDRHALKVSDDWDLKIVNSMALCQGAVVLLSKDAIASHFVRFEISNLLSRWRRTRAKESTESPFPFSPLLLDDGIVPELKKDFLEAIRITDVNYLSARPVADAVTVLVEQFKDIPDFADMNNPLLFIESLIAQLLRKTDDSQFLRTVAALVDFPPPPEPLPAAALHLARCLLVRPLNEAFQFIDRLRGVLDDSQRRALFDLVAPGWVSREAAVVLERAYTSTPPGGCVLNAEIATFTPGMYLRRARLMQAEPAGLVVAVTEPTLARAIDQLKVRVRKALARGLKVKRDPDDAGFDADLSQQIALFVTKMGRPILVSVTLEQSDLSLLDVLRAEPAFEGVTFLALCRDAQATAVPKTLEWINPELQPEQEQKASALYDVLVQNL